MLFGKPVGQSAATRPCSFFPGAQTVISPVSTHCPLISHLPSKFPHTLHVSAETASTGRNSDSPGQG